MGRLSIFSPEPLIKGKDAPKVDGVVTFLEERQKVIDISLKMNRIGINQGTSGNTSCRVPGGFLVTGSGIPYERMQPEHVVFMNLEGGYYGDTLPSSEWRMHYDIYKAVPEAQAVVHAHPTYCTALACQRRGIPAFHYMVAAAGGKEIKCADYATFGTQDLSDNMLAALGPRSSALLGNHGMICYGPDLEKALMLAHETENLARLYTCALSAGTAPVVLPDEEMDIILAKFKSYGKQSLDLAELSEFDKRHALAPPRRRARATPKSTPSKVQGSPSKTPQSSPSKPLQSPSRVPASPARRPSVTGIVLHLEERRNVIRSCLKMSEMGIAQGASSSISCRVSGGFLITASGIPYEDMQPEHVAFIDLDGYYYGDHLPCSEWRMHYDIYKQFPDAKAVLQASPTYCTALSCQRRDIPAFHYMIAAAGGKVIKCSDYATFGTQQLSDAMISSLANRRSVLLANHGMICYGPNLDKALWLANETECMAKQYMTASSTGEQFDFISPGLGPRCPCCPPVILSDEEMDVMLAKFKTYGKQPSELENLSYFERCHAIEAPQRCGDLICIPSDQSATDVIVKKKQAFPSLSGSELQARDEDDSAQSSTTEEERAQNANNSARSPLRIATSAWLDAATLSILGHGLSTLVLAFSKPLVNLEPTGIARAASQVVRGIHINPPKGTHIHWPGIQPRNTEHAPMLALLCFGLKYKADRNLRRLTLSEGAACISSLVFSLICFLATATEGGVNHFKIWPRSGGTRQLRPIGSIGRYFSQAWLLLELLLRR